MQCFSTSGWHDSDRRLLRTAMEPSLLPLNVELTAYHVQFSILGRDICFNILNVPPPSENKKSSLVNAKLECDNQLRRLLAGSEYLIQQRLNQNTDVEDFALEMRDILENAFGTGCALSLPSSGFYCRVYSELDTIGWENVLYLGTDLSTATVRVFDRRRREHVVEISLPLKYPEAAPIISLNLPIVFDLQWSREFNLQDAIKQLNDIIEKFQDFWDVMEDFDNHVWVMEPACPSRGSSFRRIALGGHCSFSLNVNACSPRSIPECRFFGSDAVITPLRKKWNSSMKKWNLERFPRTNIEDILEITFPLPQADSHEDFSADCGICYVYRLPNEGTVPDRACDNPNCGRPFHNVCLTEWLRSVKTTRQSFDVLFGSCPYCSYSIAVKA